MEQRNRRPSGIGLGGILIRVALVLAVLALLCVHLMGGLFAKYTTSGQGSDSARVIKFHELKVSEEGSFALQENGKYEGIFIPGVDMTKKIRIEFGGSEAATVVLVSVDATGWNATSDHMSFSDSQNQLSWSVDPVWKYLLSEGDVHVYYQTLEPNTVLMTTPFVRYDTIKVSDDGTVDMYKNYPDTDFTVRAYAVQANGFEKLEDAWKAAKR